MRGNNSNDETLRQAESTLTILPAPLSGAAIEFDQRQIGQANAQCTVRLTTPVALPARYKVRIRFPNAFSNQGLQSYSPRGAGYNATTNASLFAIIGQTTERTDFTRHVIQMLGNFTVPANTRLEWSHAIATPSTAGFGGFFKFEILDPTNDQVIAATADVDAGLFEDPGAVPVLNLPGGSIRYAQNESDQVGATTALDVELPVLSWLQAGASLQLTLPNYLQFNQPVNDEVVVKGVAEPYTTTQTSNRLVITTGSNSLLNTLEPIMFQVNEVGILNESGTVPDSFVIELFNANGQLVEFGTVSGLATQPAANQPSAPSAPTTGTTTNPATGTGTSGTLGGSTGGGGGGSTGGSTQPSGAGATGGSATPNHPFTDIRGHWAERYIAAAYSRGVVNGKTATQFDPDAPITRGINQNRPFESMQSNRDSKTIQRRKFERLVCQLCEHRQGESGGRRLFQWSVPPKQPRQPCRSAENYFWLTGGQSSVGNPSVQRCDRGGLVRTVCDSCQNFGDRTGVRRQHLPPGPIDHPCRGD
ncbi:S-layer homology domain-containing protein [Candidatus Peregrinibacteria bacterium]|nr:MAG: S-layer homology domain-containing protein [Candidatus Peregrinibacteria bacterium]